MKTYYLFLLLFVAFQANAQKSDCGGVYRGLKQIQSYFPIFVLEGDTLRLKADTHLSMIDGDGSLLAKVKNLDYPKILTVENKECHDFAAVQSFSTIYRDSLLMELTALNEDIEALIGNNEFSKAHNQTTKALRLIKGYQILMPTDDVFTQSTANLRKIRDEIDVVLTEMRTNETMQANTTMSRKATLVDLMEIFVIEINNRIKGEKER
ncbi:MAG: hypothetical protein JNL70_18950 [Saprospiraceae bacterium]|nr:hypothetical protein [Saprospiraceae bacterium]